jgi:hypothetical protein
LNLIAFLLRGGRLDKLMRKSRASRRSGDGGGSTFAYRRSAKTAVRGAPSPGASGGFRFYFNGLRGGAAIAS